MKKVKRAILLAAGKGTRLAPLTNTIPKPLIKVQGKSFIVRLIDAVLTAGITEIYVVTGYKANCFEKLKERYTKLNFIYNPYYKQANNISSLYMAGNLIENAYVIESDLFLKNKSLIIGEQCESNYLAIPMNHSDDWCFKVDENGYIKHLAIGGDDCQQMVGISYWNEKDGARLADCIKKLFTNKANWQMYWDEVALEKYKNDFQIKTRLCDSQDVVEIDTLQELQAVDLNYL